MSTMVTDRVLNPDPQLLIDLLTEQLRLYGELRKLADLQRAHITSDEPKELLVLLGRRQRIVDALQQLNRRIEPEQAYWRRHLGGLPADQRRTVRALVGQVRDVLQGILASDEQDSRLLSARRAHTAHMMQSLGQGRQASKAYDSEQSRDRWSRTDQSA